jgi:hypothetical protein
LNMVHCLRHTACKPCTMWSPKSNIVKPILLCPLNRAKIPTRSNVPITTGSIILLISLPDHGCTARSWHCMHIEFTLDNEQCYCSKSSIVTNVKRFIGKHFALSRCNRPWNVPAI